MTIYQDQIHQEVETGEKNKKTHHPDRIKDRTGSRSGSGVVAPYERDVNNCEVSEQN